jgi:membrane protein DedA with SNARE-associated domain
MGNPATKTTVIMFLVALSVVYFSVLPLLAYMAVAGAMINNTGATGPLALFIGFPGAILAVSWWIGLRLTRPRKSSM